MFWRINFCVSGIVSKFAQSIEGMVNWHLRPKIRLWCFFVYMSLTEYRKYDARTR